MPQILEMRREGDDLWVRVPSSRLAPDETVTLYYQGEIDQLRRRAYEAAIKRIQELADGPPSIPNGECP